MYKHKSLSAKDDVCHFWKRHEITDRRTDRQSYYRCTKNIKENTNPALHLLYLYFLVDLFTRISNSEKMLK
jgi:hypothetical protein